MVHFQKKEVYNFWFLIFEFTLKLFGKVPQNKIFLTFIYNMFRNYYHTKRFFPIIKIGWNIPFFQKVYDFWNPLYLRLFHTIFLHKGNDYIAKSLSGTILWINQKGTDPKFNQWHTKPSIQPPILKRTPYSGKSSLHVENKSRECSKGLQSGHKVNINFPRTYEVENGKCFVIFSKEDSRVKTSWNNALNVLEKTNKWL